MRTRTGLVVFVAVSGLAVACDAGDQAGRRDGVAAVPSPDDATPVMLADEEVQTLAAAATHDRSLVGHVVADDDGLASVWQMGGVSGTPPSPPPGAVGLFVIARQGESTCRSVDDVVGVEVPDPDADPATIDANAVVLLDPDGEFLQPCPGPSGAHAFTAFVVAIPESYADRLGGAVARLAPSQG